MTVQRQEPKVSDKVIFDVISDGVLIERMIMPAKSIVIPPVDSVYTIEQVDTHHKDESLNGRHKRNIKILQVQVTHTIVRSRRRGSQEIQSTLYQNIVLQGTHIA